MRVKLCYTAEIEEVLPEASYMLKNLGEIFNNLMPAYNDLLSELDEEDFNGNTFFKSLDDVRQSLGRIDQRLLEVAEIVNGHEQYTATERLSHLASLAVEESTGEDLEKPEDNEEETT